MKQWSRIWFIGAKFSAQCRSERHTKSLVEQINCVLHITGDQTSSDLLRVQEATQLRGPGHDLEAVEALPLEARDDLVRVALLVGRPVLDAVEDVDGASPRAARRGVGGVPAEHLAVHGREIDDWHREGAVHVEDHPAQRTPRPGRGRGGGGHGPAAGEDAAAVEGRGARGVGPAKEQAVGPVEQAGEHACVA